MKLFISMNLVVDILDVGSIHLQCDNDLENDELHFVAIKIQTQKWKTHNVWGFFYSQQQPIYWYGEPTNVEMLTFVGCNI